MSSYIIALCIVYSRLIQAIVKNCRKKATIKTRQRDDDMTKKRFLNQTNRDYYGGGLMLLFGLGAAFQGQQYHIGNLGSMGPGFFPVALGVLLALTGAAI